MPPQTAAHTVHMRRVGSVPRHAPRIQNAPHDHCATHHILRACKHAGDNMGECMHRACRGARRQQQQHPYTHLNDACGTILAHATRATRNTNTQSNLNCAQDAHCTDCPHSARFQCKERDAGHMHTTQDTQSTGNMQLCTDFERMRMGTCVLACATAWLQTTALAWLCACMPAHVYAHLPAHAHVCVAHTCNWPKVWGHI